MAPSSMLSIGVLLGAEYSAAHMIQPYLLLLGGPKWIKGCNGCVLSVLAYLINATLFQIS